MIWPEVYKLLHLICFFWMRLCEKKDRYSLLIPWRKFWKTNSSMQISENRKSSNNDMGGVQTFAHLAQYYFTCYEYDLIERRKRGKKKQKPFFCANIRSPKIKTWTDRGCTNFCTCLVCFFPRFYVIGMKKRNKCSLFSRQSSEVRKSQRNKKSIICI